MSQSSCLSHRISNSTEQLKEYCDQIRFISIKCLVADGVLMFLKQFFKLLIFQIYFL